eukprot:14969-Heterococcus_DN1.PRE.4
MSSPDPAIAEVSGKQMLSELLVAPAVSHCYGADCSRSDALTRCLCRTDAPHVGTALAGVESRAL